MRPWLLRGTTAKLSLNPPSEGSGCLRTGRCALGAKTVPLYLIWLLWLSGPPAACGPNPSETRFGKDCDIGVELSTVRNELLRLLPVSSMAPDLANATGLVDLDSFRRRLGLAEPALESLRIGLRGPGAAGTRPGTKGCIPAPTPPAAWPGGSGLSAGSQVGGTAPPGGAPPAGGPPPATGGVVMPPPKGAPRPPLPTKSAPFGKPTAAGPPKGDTGVQCKSASAAPTPPPWQRPPEGKAFAAPHTSDDIEIQRGYQELTAMQQDFEQKHAEGERILQQQQQEVQRMEREFREHEQQRQREEMKRKKEEEERRRQEEAEALAKSLQNELEQFILIAERRAEEAKEKAALVGIDEKNDKTPDEILEAASQFDAVSAAGRMVVAQCNSFMTGKFLQLQGTTEETRTEAARRLKRVKAAESETAILVGKVMACRRQAQLQKDAQLKKLEAELAARKQEAIFSKYDRDGDGKLSAAEVGAFVSGECNFELSQEKLAAIVQSDVFKDSMGVPRAKFSHLRLLVGVAAVTGALDGMEVEVAKAETQARPLSAKGRCRMPIGPAAQKAEEVEAAVDAAQDYLAAAREQVQTLGADKPTGGEPRAVALARAEAVKLARRLDAFERRLATSAAIAKAVLDRRLLQERKAAALRDADLVASNGMM
mmetsp:Transcript_4864/g.13642  ORF Transcript_4864/g.13642 Transcript_4864/m.13642 type:complete len:655 (+) Transcript_4864:189-2153(+)